MDGNCSRRNVHLLFGSIGVLCLGLLLFRLSTVRWVSASDFDQIYLSGIVWREGRPPYGAAQPAFVVPQGPSSRILDYFLYAPLASLLAAPLTFLPFPLVSSLWQWFSFGLFLSGIARLSQLLLPRQHWTVHLFLVGLVAVSSGLRWNMYLFQPTVFVCGALFWFACCYAEQRKGWAICFALLASIKFSYLLPLVGLPLFRRDFRFLAVMLTVIATANVASMMQTGFGATLRAYRTTLAHHDHYGSSFHPSADVYFQWRTGRLPATQPNGEIMDTPGDQIHLTYIFSAWTHNVPTAKKLHAIAALVILGILAMQWHRMRDKARWNSPQLVLLLFGYLMAASLVVIYHQRYDLIALFPLVLCGVSLLRQNRRDWLALLPVLGVLVFVGLMPATLLTNVPVMLVERTGRLAFIALTGYFSLVVAWGAGRLLMREWERQNSHLSPSEAKLSPAVMETKSMASDAAGISS